MKTFLKILFFFLLVTQICFAQLEFFNYEQKSKISSGQLTDAFNVNLDSLMLDSIMSDYRISENIPGIASLIIKENRVVWNKNYGFRNLEMQLPVEDSTLFLMGSISKTIMATAVMQLWENGLIDLNGNINNYFPPGFIVKNPHYPNDTITVKMLMTHSSSLRDNYNILLQLYGCGDYPVTYDSFLINYFTPGGVYYTSQNFYNYRPGQTSNYCNFGACLLALIVEHLSGKSYTDYVRDSIFIPLSLYSSSLFLEGMDTSKIATPYVDQPPQATCHMGFPYWPIGQLRTTKVELSNFASAYLNYGIFNNHRILDSSTIALMLSDQGYTALSGGRQGLIWMTDPAIYNTVWSHTGGWFGCETALYMCKEEKWSILLFINWTTADGGYSVGFFPVLVKMAKYAQVIVGNEDELNPLPKEYSLEQNYPNPFNPSTKIKYSIPKSSQVTLKIFNTLGEEIATLVNEEKTMGIYEINWNAASTAGGLPSGVYFYRLQAGGFAQTRKMILLK